MFLSSLTAIVERHYRPAGLFPERETQELIARRRPDYLAAVERVARLCQLRGESLRDHQTSTLRALLEQSRTVPFYREKYRAAGFVPSDFGGLHDLPKIPLVDKAEWRQAPLESLQSEHPRGAATPANWLLSSSGSTGVPSRLFRDAGALWHFMARGLLLFREWGEGAPFQSGLYVLDFAPGSIDYLIADLLRTTVDSRRIVPSSLPAEEHAARLRKFRPDFVSSYPSTMRNLAIWLDRRRQTCSHVRLLHLTSEMLDRGTRALLERVFPRAWVTETYTSTEAGLIAFPCPVDGRLHVAEEGVLCEIVDERGEPTDGRGELVVTDLTNQATPVIRYRGLGDFAQWDSTPCGCGSPYRAIRQLEGRVADSIRTASGGWLSPYEVIDAIEDLPGIYQFQIVQQAEGDVDVRIVRDQAADVPAERLAEQARAALAGRLPGVRCRVEWTAHIAPATGRHKTPLVVSRLRDGASPAEAPRRRIP